MLPFRALFAYGTQHYYPQERAEYTSGAHLARFGKRGAVGAAVSALRRSEIIPAEKIFAEKLNTNLEYFDR
jgi:hypothetical protein